MNLGDERVGADRDYSGSRVLAMSSVHAAAASYWYGMQHSCLPPCIVTFHVTACVIRCTAGSWVTCRSLDSRTAQQTVRNATVDARFYVTAGRGSTASSLVTPDGCVVRGSSAPALLRDQEFERSLAAAWLLWKHRFARDHRSAVNSRAPDSPGSSVRVWRWNGMQNIVEAISTTPRTPSVRDEPNSTRSLVGKWARQHF